MWAPRGHDPWLRRRLEWKVSLEESQAGVPAQEGADAEDMDGQGRAGQRGFLFVQWARAVGVAEEERSSPPTSPPLAGVLAPRLPPSGGRAARQNHPDCSLGDSFLSSSKRYRLIAKSCRESKKSLLITYSEFPEFFLENHFSAV